MNKYDDFYDAFDRAIATDMFIVSKNNKGTPEEGILFTFFNSNDPTNHFKNPTSIVLRENDAFIMNGMWGMDSAEPLTKEVMDAIAPAIVEVYLISLLEEPVYGPE